jgi:hypothetical protein
MTSARYHAATDLTQLDETLHESRISHRVASLAQT